MDAIHRVFAIFASVQANDLTAQVADDLVHLTVLVNKSASAEAFQLAAERDLSISQMRSIFHLDGAEQPPALHELAQLIGLSVAATGRAVDGLVEGIKVHPHQRIGPVIILPEPRRALPQHLTGALVPHEVIAKRGQQRIPGQFAAEHEVEELALVRRFLCAFAHAGPYVVRAVLMGEAARGWLSTVYREVWDDRKSKFLASPGLASSGCPGMARRKTWNLPCRLIGSEDKCGKLFERLRIYSLSNVDSEVSRRGVLTSSRAASCFGPLLLCRRLS